MRFVLPFVFSLCYEKQPLPFQLDPFNLLEVYRVKEAVCPALKERTKFGPTLSGISDQEVNHNVCQGIGRPKGTSWLGTIAR